MKSPKSTLIFILAMSLGSGSGFAEFKETCPRTLGSEVPLGPLVPRGEGYNWYGNKELAAAIPHDGRWTTGVKSLWWSSEIQTGVRPGLTVKIKSLSGLPNDAKVSKAVVTHVFASREPTMMVGIA